MTPSYPRLPTVGVAVAAIPPRIDSGMLARALDSVDANYYQPVGIRVAVDTNRDGAAATKNRAVAQLPDSCEYVAILDDDDEFLPFHLLFLAAFARHHDADVVYSVPTVPLYGGDHDRNHDHYFKPFDPAVLAYRPFIPTTSLFRLSVFREVGGFQQPNPSHIDPASPVFSTNPEWLGYDDWGLYLALNARQARFAHLPLQTWVWHIGDHNTSGVPAANTATHHPNHPPQE